MKNKKRVDKRKEESESSSSSSSSSSSEDDSTGSSSESSTSPVRKKGKTSKGKHSKKRQSKTDSTSSEDEPKSSKVRPADFQDERVKMDRKDLEHSKWDSPVERTDRKRKAERRESESRDREQKKDRERDRENRADRSGERDTRRDERHADRADSSRDRRINERSYSRRYEDRGRHRDYRYERYDDRDREKKDDRYHRGDDRRDRKRTPPKDQRNNKRHRSRSASFDHAKAKWGRDEQSQGDKKDGKPNNVKEKEKPNFGLSGKLTEETNTYKGVVIKYSEPPEARKPRRRWRLYPFKGEKAMQTLYIHRESAYLIGRERKVVDLPVDHPSCSKQHAALQYRLVPFTREDGTVGKRVRPYLIDLDSANGTYINNKKIDARKYVELLEKDVIKFGYSSREYVLLHENSKDEAMDDDVKLEEEEVKREPED